MAKNNLIITAVLAIIFGAGGFFGGMKYQESKTPSFAGKFTEGREGQGQPIGQVPSNGGQLQGRFGQGVAQGYNPVSGEIISVDEGSVIVSMPDGSSKIVLLTDSTTINKTEEGSDSNLVVGEQVMIFGSENSDGSVTAQNISIGGREFLRTPEAN